jgi:hypothetical protein
MSGYNPVKREEVFQNMQFYELNSLIKRKQLIIPHFWHLYQKQDLIKKNHFHAC